MAYECDHQTHKTHHCNQLRTKWAVQTTEQLPETVVHIMAETPHNAREWGIFSVEQNTFWPQCVHLIGYFTSLFKQTTNNDQSLPNIEVLHYNLTVNMSLNILPLPQGFLTIFPQQPRISKQNFTRLLHVPIYVTLQNFIQLSLTLTKLCQVKNERLVSFYILL